MRPIPISVRKPEPFVGLGCVLEFQALRSSKLGSCHRQRRLGKPGSRDCWIPTYEQCLERERT